MRGEVSVKRPRRPQIRQVSSFFDPVSGCRCRRDQHETATTAAVTTATGSHEDNAGDVRETEP